MAILFACLPACVQSGKTEATTAITYNKAYRRDVHWVHKGDTLYSIAWQYGLNYQDIAKWNNITLPYRIYVGQQLIITAKYQKKPLVVKTTNKKEYSAKQKKKTIPIVQKTPLRDKKNSTFDNLTEKKDISLIDKIIWKWPANGKIVQRFAPISNFKGIDIAAKLGAKVYAAAKGIVVYHGSGLNGYGNLLILKHNAHFFSAYGHNKVLLVKDQEVVQAGQLIAYMGKSESDRVKLHFEIRKDGKPVDPLHYLPK